MGKSWRDSGVAINPATGGQIAIQVSEQRALLGEASRCPRARSQRCASSAPAYVQDVAWNKSQTTLRMVDWYLPAVNRVVMTWHDSSYYDYQQAPRNALIRGDRLRWSLIEHKAAP